MADLALPDVDDLTLSEFAAFVRGVTGDELPPAVLTKALAAAKQSTGTVPASFSQDALRAADFVTLPDGVEGTNCSNCRHQLGGICQFVEEGTDLRGLAVTERDCCAEWDADGARRVWRQQKAISLPWYVAKDAGPHDYATTMLLIPENVVGGPDVTAAFLQRMQRRIADDDLHEKGRETEMHVTVKYGLMTSDPEEVRQYVRSYGVVRLTLGDTTVFRGDEYDVVYVEVNGNGVRDLNTLIAGSVPFEDDHPVYAPHVTLAYVKPGLGAKYAGLSDVAGTELTFDTLTFADPQGTRTKIKLDDPEAPSEEVHDPERLLELPDVRQHDSYSCGAACAMAAGRYFGVGPETLEEWKAALGTTEETSTLPAAVVAYLRSLGLSAEPRADLTLDDLRRAWGRGRPVVCCVQEYGVPSKQASYKYGHYVVVVGVSLGYVFVQDPSADNALGRPGGSQGPEGSLHTVEGQVNVVADPDSLQAPGRNMIREGDFLRVWHDEDVLSNKLDSYGIIVGPSVNEIAKVLGQKPYYEVVIRLIGGRESRVQIRDSGEYGLQQARQEVQNWLDRDTKLAEQGRPKDVLSTKILAARYSGDSSKQKVRWTEVKSIRKSAGTCKPGQTAATTGCTPATGGGGAGSVQSGPSSQETTAGDRGAVLAALGKAAAKYADVKATARRFGKAGFAKLPPRTQRVLTKMWGWAKYVEHKLMTGFTKAKELAQAVGRERGLSAEQTDRLGRVLATADLVTAWTINMPATIAVTGSVTAGKVASWVPVASLAYIAYSTARNPAATARAAKAVLGKGKHKGRDQRMTQAEFAAAVADRLQTVGARSDWYLALLHAALDDEDTTDALALADAAFDAHPVPPPETDADVSERDGRLVPGAADKAQNLTSRLT